ncbi:MAG TPA: hypothetical protein VIT23_18150 [Terrimicrobiaceae bacterium]
MCSGKEGWRFAKTIALLGTIAMPLLLSCAHRKVTATPPAPISAKIPIKEPETSARAKPRTAPPAEKPSLGTLMPRPQPSRAAQIIALVDAGQLVNHTGSTLLFSKTGLTRSAQSGLFEDAILLARLRRTLKETSSLPDSLSATATVRDGKAVLTIDSTLSVPAGARAIDAALRTPGIIAVQAGIKG